MHPDYVGYFFDINLPENLSSYLVDTNNALHLSADKKDDNYITDSRIISGFENESNVLWYIKQLTGFVVEDSNDGEKLSPKSMNYWFNGQTLLSSLPISSLEKIDSWQLTSMNYTFYNCYILTKIDMSSFDDSTITSMDNTFADCSNLKTIYADSNK